jgi:Bacterial-like globin
MIGDRPMTETLYEHAGGDEALHRLEEVFYARALSDPVLKDVFTERVATHVDHLTWFTAESFGGPDPSAPAGLSNDMFAGAGQAPRVHPFPPSPPSADNVHYVK